MRGEARHRHGGARGAGGGRRLVVSRAGVRGTGKSAAGVAAVPGPDRARAPGPRRAAPEAREEPGGRPHRRLIGLAPASRWVLTREAPIPATASRDSAKNRERPREGRRRRCGSSVASNLRWSITRRVGPMATKVTLLELVDAVSEHARSEDETIATIIYMVNRGVVRLCGTFKGARFDLRTLAAA